MAEADLMYDTKGAARYLGGIKKPLSERTLQRNRQIGGGPRFIRVGRLIRYRKSDLDAWLESRVRTSTSEDRS